MTYKVKITEELSTGIPAGRVATSDGSGGVEWADVPPGGGWGLYRVGFDVSGNPAILFGLATAKNASSPAELMDQYEAMGRAFEITPLFYNSVSRQFTEDPFLYYGK